MDQPVTDTVGSGPVNTLYMIDNSDPKWVKVEIIKTIVVDEYKGIQDYEAVLCHGMPRGQALKQRRRASIK